MDISPALNINVDVFKKFQYGPSTFKCLISWCMMTWEEKEEIMWQNVIYYIFITFDDTMIITGFIS